MREKGRKSECILTSGERPLPTCCARRTRRSAPPRWRKNSPSRARSSWAISRCCAPRGEEILATPRGYVTPKEARGILRRVAVKHTPQEMEAELNTIVDNGCTVIDVIVDHPHLRPAHRPAANFEPLRGQPVYRALQKGRAFIEPDRWHPPAHALLSRRGGVRAHEECAARTARPAGGKRKLRVDNPHTSDYSVMCTCQDTCI